MKTSEFIKSAARGAQAMKLLNAIANRALNGVHSGGAWNTMSHLGDKLPTWKPTFVTIPEILRSAKNQMDHGGDPILKQLRKEQTDAIAHTIRDWRKGRTSPGGAVDNFGTTHKVGQPQNPRI
jgi:hypothetical protein